MYIKIYEKLVSNSIFDTKDVKEKIDQLFEKRHKDLQKRFLDTMQEINEDPQNSKTIFHFKDFKSQVKECFIEYIANKAIDITFDGEGKYNLKDNILMLITEDYFNTIYDDISFKAFIYTLDLYTRLTSKDIRQREKLEKLFIK